MAEEAKQNWSNCFPIQLDRYTLVDLIGSGGMGEVFLAEDPVFHRKVALKQLLTKRKDKESARARFKKEARIAAQLSHPSIIPIYDLHDNGENLYYTMPYLEGKTLKEILIATRLTNEQGLFSKTIGGSIPSLMLAFINVCQATEHTHEKGFIHRDLKPENIVIGKYNEVTILDWGVATEIPPSKTSLKKGPQIKEGAIETVHLKGAAGTIEYMAPERAFGHPASVQSDIYSLGVILYFMLTLELPHKRPGSLKEWRALLEKKGSEPCKNPQDVAPYREITEQLSRITLKCLHPETNKRYRSVQEIIKDLERYIEGKPDWIQAETFDVQNATDWKFQESIILTKQRAISRGAGVMEWILFMLSKNSYSGNIQIQATVHIQEEGSGIGFMMCVPTNDGQQGLGKGYQIWIGSQKSPGVKLFRDNIEISRVDHIFLKPTISYVIAVEKQDNLLRLLINDETTLTYLSHFPILGGHFGLISKDAEFDISPLTLSTGSQDVLVNCLSVPDAFLLNGDYSRALTEYRRIADSFKGRPEGRQAIFRAGVTLIEEGKKRKETAQNYFTQALDEFELLHKTPGAPIEYLGKSLVYQAENNLEEEIKCLELALRKFPKHPLRHVLDEQVLFRLHETAQKDRIGAYSFILLMLQHIPRSTISNLTETDRLIRNLTASWEPLPFIRDLPSTFSKSEGRFSLAIALSFWLAKPGSLYELILGIPKECPERFSFMENGLLSLFELNYPNLIKFILTVKCSNESDPRFLFIKNSYEIAIEEAPLPKRLDAIQDKASDALFYSLLSEGLTLEQAPTLLPYFEKLTKGDPLHIWGLLLSEKRDEAKKHLEGKPIEDTSSLYFLLQGCFLAATKGEGAAHSHFSSLLDVPFPHSPNLLGHFLKGTIQLKGGAWIKQAFLWEKIQLYKQLTLYYTCLRKYRKAAHWEKMISTERSKYAITLNVT